MMPAPLPEDTPEKFFRYLLLVFLAGLLALTAAFAFHWRYYHDLPIYYYASLLIDKFGVIPYRDLRVPDLRITGEMIAPVFRRGSIGSGEQYSSVSSVFSPCNP
jgi:hypothetical protein